MPRIEIIRTISVFYIFIFQNIISTPVSKALRIDFEPVVIPGDTDVPITIGTLVYDCEFSSSFAKFCCLIIR